MGRIAIRSFLQSRNTKAYLLKRGLLYALCFVVCAAVWPDQPRLTLRFPEAKLFTYDKSLDTGVVLGSRTDTAGNALIGSGPIEFWSLVDGRRRFQIPITSTWHGWAASKWAITYDGSLLLEVVEKSTAEQRDSSPGRIRVWSVAKQEVLEEFPTGTPACDTFVTVSPIDHRIIVVDKAKCVGFVWDLDQHKLLFRFAGIEPNGYALFSPSAKYIWGRGNLLNGTTGETLLHNGTNCFLSSFSPNDEWVVIDELSAIYVSSLWRTEPFEKAALLENPDMVTFWTRSQIQNDGTVWGLALTKSGEITRVEWDRRNGQIRGDASSVKEILRFTLAKEQLAVVTRNATPFWNYWYQYWRPGMPRLVKWVVYDLKQGQVVMSKTDLAGFYYLLVDNNRTLLRCSLTAGTPIEVYDFPLRRPWLRIALAALLPGVCWDAWRRRRKQRSIAA